MTRPLLQSKLNIPLPRPALVPRPRLVARLTEGLHRKLTLISAPAGFGKSTLLSAWLRAEARAVAWLSLDAQDSDPTRFLNYLIAALQQVDETLGAGAVGLLQSTPAPPVEAIIARLLNDLATRQRPLILVLDDYHLVESPAIDAGLAFLLAHLPPQRHLVISSRADPSLPLARLRARDQLTELRAADLRFTPDEAAAFLKQETALTITPEQVGALEQRTEGWIAGLQLAALALRGQSDVDNFLDSFTGSHRFVLDYLMEEVLGQQSDSVQSFLQRTAPLDRLCGPLCDAVLAADPGTGQTMLEALDRANLFLVPLDNERRWYRYHHLFAELLRQRSRASNDGDVTALHHRASQWYEDNGMPLEAFQHAAAAHDVARAARLIEGDGLPLYFRGEAAPVRAWLAALTPHDFQANPALRVMYASVLTMTGHLRGDIEAILQAAEAALSDKPDDARTADLFGQIAAIRAMLAVPKNQVDEIISQSERALRDLHPDNAPMRTTTSWTLGYAYQVQGNYAAASQAYAETIAQSQRYGNLMTEIAATTCLGQIQELENQPHQAAQSYRRILDLVGDPPWPAACEASVGLGRLHYQWNDLAAAERFGVQGLALAQQLENVDTPAACGVLLSRVYLAQGDTDRAGAALTEAERFVRDSGFDQWRPEITALRLRLLLHQQNLVAAIRWAEGHDLPLSQARIHLAQGAPAAALAALASVPQQPAAQNGADTRLRHLLLQALAHQAAEAPEAAARTIDEALAMAAPAGLLRPFLDEGDGMAALLRDAAGRGVTPDFVQRLLAAFGDRPPPNGSAPPLLDPLSARERDVLALLTTDLTGPEIAREMMVSLNTVRTHTKNIYSKLGVNSRRAAVRRAAELALV